VDVRINIDGYFEYVCKSCQASTSWRILGAELPMHFNLLDAEGDLEAEKRFAVITNPSERRQEATAGPKAPEPASKTKGVPKASQRASKGVDSTDPLDLDELIAERTPADPGMDQWAIWKEQATSSR
jgi:hypothetical protein